MEIIHTTHTNTDSPILQKRKLLLANRELFSTMTISLNQDQEAISRMTNIQNVINEGLVPLNRHFSDEDKVREGENELLSSMIETLSCITEAIGKENEYYVSMTETIHRITKFLHRTNEFIIKDNIAFSSIIKAVSNQNEELSIMIKVINNTNKMFVSITEELNKQNEALINENESLKSH